MLNQERDAIPELEGTPSASSIKDDQEAPSSVPSMITGSADSVRHAESSSRSPLPGAGGVHRGASKVKVVANLPYNITKEFLKLMLPKGDLVSELNIMIQV